MSDNVSSREESLALVRLVVNALDDKKASDIRVFEIREQSSVTDFVVVATGTSDPHLRALGNEVDKALDDANIRVLGVESQPESGWTVVDAFHVMVHVFRADQRANFQIEKLWKDAKELPSKQFLSAVAAPASEQAVPVSGKLRAPVAKKPAKPAPGRTKDTAIVVRKSVVKRTAAVKSLPETVKEPNKKRTVKVAAKIAAKVKAKQKPAKGAKAKVADEAPVKPKKAVAAKPASKAVKKIIGKKAAKAAKTTRAIAKQKAKSGVVTRKARPLR